MKSSLLLLKPITAALFLTSSIATPAWAGLEGSAGIPFVVTANNTHGIDVRLVLDNADPWYPYIPNPSFKAPISVGTDPGCNYGKFAIADFTGDGLLDFIASTHGCGTTEHLYLFTRQVDGTFAQTPLFDLDADRSPSPTPDYGQGLTAADLDHDGDIDFLDNINGAFSHGYWIAKGNAYLNDGLGNFTKVPNAFDFSSIYTGWTLAKSSTLMDVDGNGIPDMLASEQANGGTVNSKVYLLKGNGNGTFAAPIQVFTSTGHPATYMTLGDFNNDGKADALVGQDDDGDPGQVYLFFGKGDGTFVQTAREAFDVKPSIENGSDQPGGGNFQAYDVDRDDVLDVISVYKNKGLDDPDEHSTLVYIRGLGNGNFEAPITIATGIVYRTAAQAPPAFPLTSAKLAVWDVQSGDLNHDSCNDTDDAAVINTEILRRDTYNPAYDLNHNGAVNVTDARWLVTHFTNPLGTKCPARIPPYAPNFWNDQGQVQGNNNCYNYANNKRTDTRAQPGLAAGIDNQDMSCDAVKAGATADGIQPLPASGSCPAHLAKTALVVAPGYDYHWYRLDSNGMWSHKPGGSAARNTDNSDNVIANPETANRGDYINFCGYFCSRSDREQGAGHENIQ